MNLSGKFLLAGLASAVVGATDVALAQSAPMYVVTYVEVAPDAAGQAAALLKQLRTASRKDAGNLRFEVLQRTAPANQFAIVAIWKDKAAHDAHQLAPHTKHFASEYQTIALAPMDHRTHTGLAADANAVSPAPGKEVFVVTHVDVPPPSKDKCVDALHELVAASRKESGAVRFEVFQQESRPNHFSVVEVWRSEADYLAHITAARTKRFRGELGPMTGALYDERLYKAM